MITAPFELPAEREKVIEKLAAKASAPHGGMMGEAPKEKPDAEAVWKSLSPIPIPVPHSPFSVPLVFYIHIPFCVARCAFCGFYRNQTNDEAMRYSNDPDSLERMT